MQNQRSKEVDKPLEVGDKRQKFGSKAFERVHQRLFVGSADRNFGIADF